ncbi:GNAT family N-acetyltransferase [Paenibacillus sp. MMO-177]|uniref:GNAT family N-acetyltransferase n=1 Tax=Paenibacillus sp. MMO-177 TaxID=3081289 RepID=UPI0030196472
MFKSVKSDWELAVFNSIWVSVWEEKGYELEHAAQVVERYLAVAEDGQCVGTSEIKPYLPGLNEIDTVAPFQQHIKIIEDPTRVAEIDKIAVLQHYRGQQPISDLLSSAVYCAEKYNFRYFISLLEPVFYRALRITFRVPMEKVGGKTFYKGDDVIPVIFDMESIYRNKEAYNWLVYPAASHTRSASRAI